MNHCNSLQTLKSIDSNITSNTTTLTNMNTSLSNIQADTNTNANNINSINVGLTTSTTSYPYQTKTSLSNIESDVSAIKTDVDTLAKKKIVFNARLSDGSNNYLPRSNYSGSPIDFSWSNGKGSPVYIYQYRFIYPSANEPDSDELYHSTAVASNVGAMNSAGDDYEAPYITVNDNKDYMRGYNGGGRKETWVTDNCFIYRHEFQEAPIEIGISRKFGHHITSNMSTGDYGGDPIGIIDGYYYTS